jgi:hypothetical protein
MILVMGLPICWRHSNNSRDRAMVATDPGRQKLPAMTDAAGRAMRSSIVARVIVAKDTRCIAKLLFLTASKFVRWNFHFHQDEVHHQVLLRAAYLSPMEVQPCPLAGILHSRGHQEAGRFIRTAAFAARFSRMTRLCLRCRCDTDQYKVKWQAAWAWVFRRCKTVASVSDHKLWV